MRVVNLLLFMQLFGMFLKLDNTNADSFIWKYHVSSGMKDNVLLEYRIRKKGIWQISEMKKQTIFDINSACTRLAVTRKSVMIIVKSKILFHIQT